jgi:serine/threonine-protein kinase
MQIGQRVGPFDIEKQLGSGAMGTVYQARYRKNGKRVAIKVMLAGLGTSETAVARFEREWEVLKQLTHPNIVQFYIANQFQGAPYYAMEFVEGEPLDELLVRRGRLPWEEVVEIGKQVCAALKHAHDQGIIHRDIKPSNLMKTADSTIKLTDFGIAKDLDVTQLTAANCTVGTASYMSPEQCRGERDLTHKSDLYSLGVVFYELLTGRRPFLAETTMDMFLAHVHGTFERPSRLVLDIPIWLDTLVCQLLEKDPMKRPFDAGMVSQALEQVAEKVAAGRSAGVDVAKARVVDRDRLQVTSIDANDKKVARTLLSSLRKGRRKRRGKPFYEKGWFQALGIIALLGALGSVLYTVFRTPSADVLLRQAQKGMQSMSFEERLQARQGPVARFLRHYKEDENWPQVRQWADDVDVQWTWQGLRNRRKIFEEEDEAEAKMRRALALEEGGRLEEAKEQWQALVKYKEREEAKERGKGLLAERRIQAMQSVEGRHEKLQQALLQARSRGEALEPPDDAERLASEALLYEDFKDIARAHGTWSNLMHRYEKQLDQGTLVLLASKRVQELKDQLPSEKEEAAIRRDAVQQKLKEATDRASQDPLTARGLCQNIITLYERDKDNDPEMAKLVVSAQKQKEALTPKTGDGARADRKQS